MLQNSTVLIREKYSVEKRVLRGKWWDRMDKIRNECIQEKLIAAIEKLDTHL